jgi:hypothetical protein
MMAAIEDVIRWVPNHYAQHLPGEPGRWDWIIDPKDIRATRYETVWPQIVCPIVQSASHRAPFMRIAELDYSAFERFQRDIPDTVHPDLRGFSPSGDGRATDLNLLMRESVAFPDSRDEPGLQLVDIVAGTFTKAMNQILDARVWRLLGPLMVEPPQGEPAARMAVLGDGPRIAVSDYHQYVLQALTNRAKPYLRTGEPPTASGGA